MHAFWFLFFLRPCGMSLHRLLPHGSVGHRFFFFSSSSFLLLLSMLDVVFCSPFRFAVDVLSSRFPSLPLFPFVFYLLGHLLFVVFGVLVVWVFCVTSSRRAARIPPSRQWNEKWRCDDRTTRTTYTSPPGGGGGGPVFSHGANAPATSTAPPRRKKKKMRSGGMRTFFAFPSSLSEVSSFFSSFRSRCCREGLS